MERTAVVESPDQDTELEEPLDSENDEEIEEQIVESMVFVDALEQDEELMEATAAEQPTENHVATESGETVETPVDVVFGELVDIKLEDEALSVEEIIDALVLTPAGRPLRPRSASCSGQPEACIASIPLKTGYDHHQHAYG